MATERRVSYRPDIDGLRAVAVLAIILFHIDKALLPGGFVGVDVFFVISGFLITGNILKDRDAGRFSIVEFYGRRVRRIVPALLAIVSLTVVAAPLLMRPQDAERAAESGGWALASLSNVYFWLFQDTSYFAPASAEQPLLHLWSLGVEEQFYVLWPLALVALRRAPARVIWSAVGTTAVASFLLGQWLYSWDASFAYYMLPSRAGELLVGALAALWLRQPEATTLGQRARTMLATAGVLLVVFSLAWLSEARVFPGYNAVPPTLGTAALILAGSGGGSTLVSRVLSAKPLVGIGLISYSAYLWHWPLLAFYRYGYGEPGALAGTLLFGAILFAAQASYRLVELPGRHAMLGPWQSILFQYMAPAAAVCVVALGITKTDGYGLRRWSPSYQAALAAAQQRTLPPFRVDYVCQSNRLTEDDLRSEKCVHGKGNDRDRVALLWGDSNASHYVGMLATFAETAGFRVRNVEVGSCPPLLSDPNDHVQATRLADCRHSLVLVRPLVEDAAVVILAASWSTYRDGRRTFIEAVTDTVGQLLSQGKRVILIGKAPVIPTYDRRCPEKALSFPFLNCQPVSAVPDPAVTRMNALLRALAERSGVGYFDTTPFLCERGQCWSVDAEGEPRYFDSDHLTISASWKLGRSIVAQGGVPAAFRDLPARLSGGEDQPVAGYLNHPSASN